MIARLATSSLLALSLLAPLAARAQISISIGIAPPPLPVYQQPPPPADGYLWTPGYWAWNEVGGGYYWVPGTWVLAPRPGYLWTPGYWSFVGASYRWNHGYWGPRVGFYGGIAYGFGYTGRGYDGGRWDRGVFHYNAAVNNVNTTVVRNVYRTEVVNNTTYNVTRVSYNGGAGVKAEPTADEMQARQAPVVDPTPNQVEHERKALKAPTQKATDKGEAPRVVATTRAAALDAPDAVRGSNRTSGDPTDNAAAVAKARKEDAGAKSGNTKPGTGRPPADAAEAAKAAAAKKGAAGAKDRERDAKQGSTGSAAGTNEQAARSAAAHRPVDRPDAAPANHHSDEAAARTQKGRSAPPDAKERGARQAERDAQARGGKHSDGAAPSASAEQSRKENERG